MNYRQHLIMLQNSQYGSPFIKQIENLNCPKCGKVHEDIDDWADKPHKTHLCLHCGLLFEGTKKAVSNPRYTAIYLKAKAED